MSKIPTVNAFIETNVKNDDGSNKSIQQLLKEFGELVRIETLKVAADKSVEIGSLSLRKQSILDLINSPNLEIK